MNVPLVGSQEGRPESRRRQDRRTLREIVHAVRVAIFLALLLLVHQQHRRELAAGPADGRLIPIEQIRQLFPEAATSDIAEVPDGVAAADRAEQDAAALPVTVRNAAGEQIGTVVQTSPLSDRIIGFSGPTNLLIGFGNDGRIVGLLVLSSGDTREHVAQVVEHPEFLSSLNGLTWEEVAAVQRVDGVSGATLTSMAIAESVVHRLGGSAPSMKFPDPPPLDAIQTLFPTARSVTPTTIDTALWDLHSDAGLLLGSVLRSSPAADQLVGYQGPTDTLIGLVDGKIVGLAIGRSYDNEPYVTYVREEQYFLKFFNGKQLDELAAMDLDAAGVEGVSGATMTSQNVAAGIRAAAERHLRKQQEFLQRSDRAVSSGWGVELTGIDWSARNLGTMAVTLLGILIGFTSLRGNIWVQRAFRCLLIVYLGFVNGDMVSQALLVGWAKGGLPWRTMSGPLLLTAAALLLPMTTKRNIYCSHLCPHGAAQQWLVGRVRWQFHPGPRLHRVLSAIPAILLFFVVAVGMGLFSFSLVDLEPFDAYLFRIAGWATLSIAVVGLLASLVTPMAYCRFGCPTGGLLNYLRRHRRSDELGAADFVAVSLLLFAIAVRVV